MYNQGKEKNHQEEIKEPKRSNQKSTHVSMRTAELIPGHDTT